VKSEHDRQGGSPMLGCQQRNESVSSGNTGGESGKGTKRETKCRKETVYCSQSRQTEESASQTQPGRETGGGCGTSYKTGNKKKGNNPQGKVQTILGQDGFSTHVKQVEDGRGKGKKGCTRKGHQS